MLRLLVVIMYAERCHEYALKCTPTVTTARGMPFAQLLFEDLQEYTETWSNLSGVVARYTFHVRLRERGLT